MSNLFLKVDEYSTKNKFYQEWLAGSESDIAGIPTEPLEIGSNVLCSDSALTYKRWNGTDWVKAE